MRFVKGVVDAILFVVTWANLFFPHPEMHNYIALGTCGYWVAGIIFWLDEHIKWGD